MIPRRRLQGLYNIVILHSLLASVIYTGSVNLCICIRAIRTDLDFQNRSDPAFSAIRSVLVPPPTRAFNSAGVSDEALNMSPMNQVE